MSKILIPSCDDLVSMFGCDCSIDENYTQKIGFLDEDASELNIYIGLVDDSVRIILNKNSTIVNDIYMEKLEEFYFEENKQIIKMIFNSSYKITIEIELWSKFMIKISGMVI
ncbi:hypothetical protein GCM10023206_06430 [Acinetobacter puyangensis]|uniref:Uncharacterized protein n=1 Tax=Acinetobacter puyangensis TaxID=1096779 RepID=A0A240EAR0_9GAMM|nr:hypothetical protein [Acinetobacter puyangensis]SNX45774.1 hypothetical protein SAMN05421731_1068 [Acinetobacter puyangensis]